MLSPCSACCLLFLCRSNDLQVLLSIGYLILANTLVKLTIFHDLRGDAYEGNSQKKRVTRLMELALLVAMYAFSPPTYTFSVK